MVISVQAESQLEQQWGRAGAKTIWQNSTIVMLSGMKDDETLRKVSDLCGTKKVQRQSHSTGHRSQSTTTGEERVPVLDKSELRKLGAWRALIIHRDAPPIVGQYDQVWNRSDVKATRRPRQMRRRRKVVAQASADIISLDEARKVAGDD
jgi:type IV secretory pathway TraG/TraD family ATPase VirD4